MVPIIVEGSVYNHHYILVFLKTHNPLCMCGVQFSVLRGESQNSAQQHMHWLICTQISKHVIDWQSLKYTLLPMLLYRLWFEWVPGSIWESVFSWTGYWNRTWSLLWILQRLLTTVQVRASSHIPLTFDCDLTSLIAFHFWSVQSIPLILIRFWTLLILHQCCIEHLLFPSIYLQWLIIWAIIAGMTITIFLCV